MADGKGIRMRVCLGEARVQRCEATDRKPQGP